MVMIMMPIYIIRHVFFCRMFRFLLNRSESIENTWQNIEQIHGAHSSLSPILKWQLFTHTQSQKSNSNGLGTCSFVRRGWNGRTGVGLYKGRFVQKPRLQGHSFLFTMCTVAPRSASFHGRSRRNRRLQLVLIGWATDSGAAEWERLGLFMYDNENWYSVVVESMAHHFCQLSAGF